MRAKHILIDSNLLLLLLIGRVNPTRIALFKRTSKYTTQHFRALTDILISGPRPVTTPNILTEVSNLAGQLTDPERSKVLGLLRLLVETIDERYVASKEAVAINEFTRLGLTDAGIMSMKLDRCVVISDDLPLVLALKHRGIDAVNFSQQCIST